MSGNRSKLSAAVREFSHWRSTRKHKCRIPDKLWKMAVDLVGDHSLCEVSRSLNLNYGELKRRLAIHSTETASVESSSFIELSSPLPSVRHECTIRSKDSSLEINYKGSDEKLFLSWSELILKHLR